MDTEIIPVKRSMVRQTSRITLDDGSIWSAPVGTPLEEYYKVACPDLIPTTRLPGADGTQTIVGAVVNGKLRELTYRVDWDARVSPVMLHDSDGLRIYRRSLSFVMLVAAKELFPDRTIVIDHSLPFGGYYCKLTEGCFSADELAQVKARMLEIIDQDAPIIRTVVSLDEAVAFFKKNGYDDKLRLMENRTKDYLILYELRGVRDYFYGYMVPSAGYLTTFDLTHDGDGFIMRHPRRHAPTVIQPIIDLPKLRGVFMQTAEWLELLGVEDIGELNQAIRAGRARELVLVAEALHEGRIADIADDIVERDPPPRLVLLSGPSSSGKTTTSKRLAIQLLAHGLKPYTIEMDNYFVDREKTPRDENGDFNFEHLNALDVDLFNEHMLKLMNGESVQLPRFNFITGKQEPGDKVRLSPDQILIVEGIHGLNPELVRNLPRELTFRVYVSCLTQLNIDRHNRVPTTDVRLLRRMVRDAAYRGYSATDTLSRWRSVRKGERTWIFPFQENADVIFNSALVYELAMLRPLAEPLLLQVEHGTQQHIEAKRLLSFLGWVSPLKPDIVPDNSVLREFVGDSILRDYKPGQPG